MALPILRRQRGYFTSSVRIIVLIVIALGLIVLTHTQYDFSQPSTVEATQLPSSTPPPAAAATGINTDEANINTGINTDEANVNTDGGARPTEAIKATTATTTNNEQPTSYSPWKGQRLSVRGYSDSDDSSSSKRLEMPAIGYGTCCRKSAKGTAIYKSTKIFLELGGRHIDTATVYNNHKEIGRAIQDMQFTVERSDLWITSKIHTKKVKGRENTFKAVETILKELQTPYLDLCLIHTPEQGKQKTIQLWEGLIDAAKAGLVKAIGVSNMNQHEISDLKEATGVLPAVNQIQFHPWTAPEWRKLQTWQSQNDIVTIAYTSLGGSRFHVNNGAVKWPSLLTELAKKYHATTAQLLLQWALKQNVAVIPGSGSRAHIQENLHLPDVELTLEERERLESLQPPAGWWHPKRGPIKMKDDQALKAWVSLRERGV